MTPMTPTSLAAGFAVGLLLFILVFLLVTTYNAIVALRQRIDKAWANIEVALKQRHDELPNLVAADRRELYNDSVYRYNTRIAQLPAVLLAGLFGWTSREFFKADPADLERPAGARTAA